MSTATMSASSAAAWAGKSLVDASKSEKLGQVVLNNNLGATHSVAGLETPTQSDGAVIDVINRGASPVILAANDTAAAVKDRFASAMTIPAGGKVRLFYNGLNWEPYTDSGLPDYGTVASAATIVPVAFVNSVTGTTNISAITGTNVPQGKVIRFIFTGSLTVSNGASLMLAGAVNFSATADDVLSLVWDGSKWREVGRSVN